MNRATQPDSALQVIIGVDTHKYQHVAVAIDERGARLGELSISADSNGYQQLHDWAQDYGRVKAYASRAPAVTVWDWRSSSVARGCA